MTGVIPYITLVIAISALLCGHHGEDFPPIGRALRRRARRPGWAYGPIRARRFARRVFSR
ncbi:hypothetical protein PV735_05445 [Streptomyces turgidiscabies]|uniref:Uncharacterized protein n=1 Tax=Streptomyces turgidiscabies (strain Car8) TaxID=698760 RepID=L7F0Q0_STRT8|nr:hypothetical protein [Streptomyces turgidiscabies]ELP64145.1 hypothetical protein STRTUCAR8_05559 [Streptomyces turgidiscabies Car8]MDX3492134.1 hypothetical protein [Streptomyces turgidiscabies]